MFCKILQVHSSNMYIYIYTVLSHYTVVTYNASVYSETNACTGISSILGLVFLSVHSHVIQRCIGLFRWVHPAYAPPCMHAGHAVSEPTDVNIWNWRSGR